MTNEIKYGVISDVHQDPRVVPLAIEVLKKEGAEKLLGNGDLVNRQKTLKDTQDYFAFVLNSFAKSGLESFLQPGSHETMGAYEPVMNYFSDKFSNIIDVTKNRKIEQEGHDLVFLPGSDFSCGGEYLIRNDDLPTGTFIQTDKGLIKSDYETYFNLLSSGKGIPETTIQGVMNYNNLKDLKKLVTNPDKTIVVCHVPKKFDNLENCVDLAEFGKAKEDFEIDGKEVKKEAVLAYLPAVKQMIQAGYPVEIKKENRGNEDLKNLYEELGISKAVSGHFHESGHRANDGAGNHVLEGKLTNELFWNSGHLDAGQTGILTVKDNEVSYRNINLKDYMKKK